MISASITYIISSHEDITHQMRRYEITPCKEERISIAILPGTIMPLFLVAPRK